MRLQGARNCTPYDPGSCRRALSCLELRYELSPREADDSLLFCSVVRPGRRSAVWWVALGSYSEEERPLRRSSRTRRRHRTLLRRIFSGSWPLERDRSPTSFARRESPSRLPARAEMRFCLRRGRPPHGAQRKRAKLNMAQKSWAEPRLLPHPGGLAFGGRWRSLSRHPQHLLEPLLCKFVDFLDIVSPARHLPRFSPRAFRS